MNEIPPMQDILFITINWLCIFFFPLLMRYLIARSVHQSNVNTTIKDTEDFWSGYDPFVAISSTYSKNTKDSSLILFRKLISLLALSFFYLLMAFWAWMQQQTGIFYIISTFFIFTFYVRSLSMFNQLTFKKFIVLTSLLIISFLVIFYINPVAYFIFCLAFNLFITPLYIFCFNKHSLKLDFWAFSFAYLLNLFTFISIALFFKHVNELVSTYSNEVGIAIVVAVFLMLFVPYVTVLLAGGRNKIKILLNT